MSTIVPLFGTGNQARSKFVSDQRRLNCYAETPKDQDKSALPIYSRPGLRPYQFTRTTFSNLPAPINGPMRGALFATYNQNSPSLGIISQRSLVFVEGNQIWNLSELTGNATPYGGGLGSATGPAMVTSSGPVQIADNGKHVVVVDGAAGYLFQYNTTASAPSNGTGQITDVDFPVGPTTVAYLASRFIVNDRTNPGRFYWSDLLDGSSWDGLNFATAESNPDALTRIFESGGTLFLIGTATTEFWSPQTSGSAAFARVGGAGIDWGTTAIHSVAKYQGGVVMLARNLGGARQVIMISGYTPQVISNPDVENAINADPAPDAAIGSVMTISGHAFYVLNLTNTSWVFNGQTGSWDEWQTAGSRWAGNFVTQSFGGTQFVTDARSDVLNTLDAGYLYDGTTPIIRETISRHLFHDYERMTVDKLTIDAQVGATSVTPTYNPLSAKMTGSNTGTAGAGSANTGNSFSLQFWFRTQSSATQVCLSKSVASGNTWQVYLDLGLLQFQLVGSTILTTAYTAINTWTQVTATYDATAQVMNLYVNGALAATQSSIVNTGGGTASLTTNVGPSLVGDIDDVRIWNRVLSAAEVAANTMTQYSANTPGLAALYNTFTNDGTLAFANQGSNGGTLTFTAGTLFEARTNQTYQGTPRSPQMMLQISRDNGNTWGNEMWQSMGLLGHYRHRISWNRLGRARDFLFRTRVADPVDVTITGGAVSMR